MATERGSKMDLLLFAGVIACVGAFVWAILAFTQDELDKAIKDAQNWDTKQKRIKQALERE